MDGAKQGQHDVTKVPFIISAHNTVTSGFSRLEQPTPTHSVMKKNVRELRIRAKKEIIARTCGPSQEDALRKARPCRDRTQSTTMNTSAAQHNATGSRAGGTAPRADTTFALDVMVVRVKRFSIDHTTVRRAQRHNLRNAVSRQMYLLGGLDVLLEDGLGLTTETGLLPVITALT